MFRKIKKKPVATATKRSRPADEESAEATDGTSPLMDAEVEGLAGPSNINILLQKKKQRRAPKAGIRSTTSTAIREDKTVEADESRTTVMRGAQKRPRTFGVGFGGGSVIEEQSPMPINNVSEGRYDAASLSQLTEQQPIQPVEGRADTVDTSDFVGMSGQIARNFNPNTVTGGDFIPMNNSMKDFSSEGAVLAGDEAIAFANGEGNLQKTANNGRTMDSVVGGMGPSIGMTSKEEVPGRNTGFFSAAALPTTASLSLSDVHRQFSQTQERLQRQAEELEKSLKRRHEAQEELQGQVEKHRGDLKSTGSSLEFYQSWRRDLIAFVGALREITKALPDLQSAWHDLEQDMAAMQKWRDWEDDTVAVLTRYQLVNSVVGRQPIISAELLTEGVMETDEFGRDVLSQKQRILQQRRQQRRQVQRQAIIEKGNRQRSGSVAGSEDLSVPPHLNHDFAYPSGYPVLNGPADIESFRERNKALQHAMRIVLNNLYDEYKSLQQLFELFAQWKRSFPAEYTECFASLTLADLATVLIQVELLSLNDPWNDSGGHDETKWITAVCRHYDCGSDQHDGAVRNGQELLLFDKESIERLVTKAVLPTIQDLLSEKRTYNLLSARQSRSLSKFLSHAQKLLTYDHPVLRMLQKVVVDYIKQALDDFSIPLVIRQNEAIERYNELKDLDEKELLGQTIHDATIGQIERVKKIVLNLLDHWADVLPPESGFPSVLLDFVSSKVVPLMSALQNWYWPSLSESPSDVFRQLWKEIQKYDWLDRPENMLYSTVLRATASAFHVDQDDGMAAMDTADLASDPVIQQCS
jgi:hypothetical protein